ncbi:MAG: hypothetical protein ABSH53_06275 [Holophaga sp.]|jgi:hypothetical protein
MSNDTLPDWEQVLSSAARLQSIIPDAVLVGGTAAAIHAGHRLSRDADHTLEDLKTRFDEILNTLESVAGWKTARVKRPVMILGSLDGIETGIRQLIRKEPLEKTTIKFRGKTLTFPTKAEILRIKACLILLRNATRDYLDFVALADLLGLDEAWNALKKFDLLYPQKNGESALLQLQVQLSKPLPFDLEQTTLAEYKNLDPKWHDWAAVESVCTTLADYLFDALGKDSELPSG